MHESREIEAMAIDDGVINRKPIEILTDDKEE
jgi:hypothetical protein